MSADLYPEYQTAAEIAADIAETTERLQNEYHAIAKPAAVDYISIREGTQSNLHPADRGFNVVAVMLDEYNNAEYLVNRPTVKECREWCKRNYPRVKVQRN